MKSFARINISVVVITLICFFLPWVQVSCAGARDTMSGLDLARHGHGSLWIVPVLMGALLLFAIIRISSTQDLGLALASLLCGFISAYMMNDERLRVQDEAGLISARLTGWFWLGFISTMAVGMSGVAMLLRRDRAP